MYPKSSNNSESVLSLNYDHPWICLYANAQDIYYMVIMERLKSPPPLMIVSDLDHTMVRICFVFFRQTKYSRFLDVMIQVSFSQVDHQDHENISLLRFNSLWEYTYRRDSLLIFSTARSPILYKELRKEKPLLTPDIIITSIGTEIAFGNSMVPDHAWVETLNSDKWNREIVLEESSKFPELTLQPKTEQRLHKVSFYIDEGKGEAVTKELSQLLEKRGVKCSNYLPMLVSCEIFCFLVCDHGNVFMFSVRCQDHL